MSTSTSLAAAVGAPAPVTIGEKEYTASPVDLFGLGEIEERVRAIMLAMAARSAELLSPALFDRVLKTVTIAALKVDYTSEEVTAYLQGFRGACALIVLSLKPRHPEATDKQVGEVLAKRPDQLATTFSTVMRISGYSTGDDSDGEGGQKPGEVGAVGAPG